MVDDHLFSPANAEHYATTMRAGLDVLTEHLGSVRTPFSGRSVTDVARAVDAVDLDRPVDVDAALAELRDVYLDDAVWFHDPGYAAHLNCPVVVPALLAELFVSAVNSSLDTWDQSAGGTLIERRLVDWTAGRIGFAVPAEGGSADGVFTSGGTQSNLQALLMARGETFLRGHVDPGLAYADSLARFRVFCSADAHFSVQKSATILGLDADAVVPVDVDARHRMDPVALERALHDCLARGLVPMAVVATAGTTDLGAIDPLGAVADLCAEHGVWMHVDAAYGGGLLASPRRRHRLDGIERADSVTVDFHKTFFQPVSASAVLVRDAGVLRHVTYHAEYLNPRTADLPNQVDKSLQTTRRFDALKLWLTLRVMGADAIGQGFDTAIDLAHATADWVREQDDLQLRAEPELSTVVFRYRPDGLDDDLADDLNPRIRRTLWGDGRAVVAGTKVDGRAWLKLTLLNPAATLEDVVAVLERVRSTGEDLLERDREEVDA
ncbi:MULTISPECIES: aspartate aminotransferase family protein [unclassified Aeromicrobium]|uniref:pyridoxal phosphate-dependent decarboxylase family protein n=1 Tax=unclassified Aeromicrobium TaxID=2633570 RepID=UPI0028897CDA|nr:MULTISPECIES: aspartate aminotransferase family protein [unclassified Aeromicrobium]